MKHYNEKESKMIYDDRDDGMREQRQAEISDYLGSVEDDRDFEIVIDDQDDEPNWEVLTNVSKAIEDFDLEKLTERMIEKHECELALLEEFENNCEKF